VCAAALLLAGCLAGERLAGWCFLAGFVSVVSGALKFETYVFELFLTDLFIVTVKKRWFRFVGRFVSQPRSIYRFLSRQYQSRIFDLLPN
jgi:hypothetical protein